MGVLDHLHLLAGLIMNEYSIDISLFPRYVSAHIFALYVFVFRVRMRVYARACVEFVDNPFTYNLYLFLKHSVSWTRSEPG